jgi:hypothetical protein
MEIGTDLRMHAHVGFLARGEIHIEYYERGAECPERRSCR